MKPADIHCQLCEVYGENSMSDSMVRRWVRHFTERSENVHDDPWSSRTSVVNEDLVHTVEKIQENRQFTISKLSLHFPQLSQSLLHKIVPD
jgi:transposase